MILIAFNLFFKMILIALNCKETLLPTLQRLHFRYEIADKLGLNSQLVYSTNFNGQFEEEAGASF